MMKNKILISVSVLSLIISIGTLLYVIYRLNKFEVQHEELNQVTIVRLAENSNDPVLNQQADQIKRDWAQKETDQIGRDWVQKEKATGEKGENRNDLFRFILSFLIPAPLVAFAAIIIFAFQKGSR